jgi:hypothetical protein
MQAILNKKEVFEFRTPNWRRSEIEMTKMSSEFGLSLLGKYYVLGARELAPVSWMIACTLWPAATGF